MSGPTGPAGESAGPAIDWSAPWLVPYRPAGEDLQRRLAAGAALLEGLNSLAEIAEIGRRAAAGAACASGERVGARVRFVEPAAKPSGEPYESFIARTGCIPTRRNAHDLLNALVWLTLPTLKQRLTQLQADQIEHRGADLARGAVRDALTLLDENGALLQAPPVLIDALQAGDWATLFVAQRHRWREARLLLVGHALLEKLLQPRKAITAHVWTVPSTAGDPADWLARHLEPQALAARPWRPMPVLGVPGWWNSNECAGFYDDASVFRRRAGS